MGFEVGIVALTMVKADRAQEFEDWVRSVIVPAVSRQPSFTGRWRLVRAGSGQDPVPYAFQFDGSDIDEFDSAPALVRELGEERAQVEIARFGTMLAEEQTLLVFSPPIIEGRPAAIPSDTDAEQKIRAHAGPLHLLRSPEHLRGPEGVVPDGPTPPGSRAR